MNNKNNIVKKKPVWLHECNLFLVNGCERCCKEYVKGVPYYNCKHRKVLCIIVSDDLDNMLGG